MFIYQNHMGGVYSSNKSIDFDDLYCEICGDSDREIGNIESQEELLCLLSDHIAILPEDGGLDIDYVLKFAHSCFPDEQKIGYETAKEIIVAARNMQ